MRIDVGSRILGVACLLGMACCNKPPQTAVTEQKTIPAPSQSAQVTQASTSSHAPVVRLLGKPVTRNDCLSRSNGIGSVEVGIHRLVLGVLIDDFCVGEKLALTQEEIDGLWKKMQAVRRKYAATPLQKEIEQVAKRLAEGKLTDEQRKELEQQKQQLAEKLETDSTQVPPFDEQQVRTKLEETRAKLAAPNLGWLEKITLEGQQRGFEYAIEHKSVPAALAYSELMPLKCKDALYRKYGGKVVGRQISIEPAEAYLKLVQEAEQSGRLEFLDESLKQAFWKRMNDELRHPEIPPEKVDFSLPAILQVP